MSTNWESSGQQPDPSTISDDRRRTRRRWIAIIAVAVLILAALVSWHLVSMRSAAQKQGGRFAGAGQPVGIATVARHDVRVILNQIGTVTPLATVTVQSQISGTLMTVGFKEGQLVKKGDFLMQIDPRPYQIALSQYEAQLVHDEAVHQQAETDLERYHQLLERDSIAKQTVDDQVWLVQQAAGTVSVDRAQINAQKLNLAYCHIVSPVDGRVGIRMVDPGNYVQANGGTGLVVVTELQPISVLFTVPEDAVPTVLAEFKASGMLPVTAFDRANTTQLATGSLAAVDTQVDSTTGTVKMRANFDNKDGALYPQQFVNVQLLVKVIHDALTVPKAAIQYGSSGPFVYALDADNTVSVRQVTLGTQDGELVAITAGAALGDRVVTDGADQLKGGAKVTVRSDSPAGASAGGAAPDAARKARGQGKPHDGQGAGQAGAGQHRHRDQAQGADAAKGQTQ
jgi:multidrug efflux system membrane fusion protein